MQKNALYKMDTKTRREQFLFVSQNMAQQVESWHILYRILGTLLISFKTLNQ